MRCQKDGTRQPVTCPVMVQAYNELMGGVDTGDQARDYYRMRTKFRNFTFIKDVAVTNSYILYKNHSPTPKLKSIKDFRLELATQLIGTYNSRWPGAVSLAPYDHFLSHTFQPRTRTAKGKDVSGANPRELTLRGSAPPKMSGFATTETQQQTVSWHGTRTSYNKASLSSLHMHIQVLIHTHLHET